MSPGSRLIACIACFPVTTTASAAPPLRTVGPASVDPASGRTLLAADGDRVAYTSELGRVRVVDGQLREVASVVAPADCPAWGDFGGGALLWYCGLGPPGGFLGRVYDLATKKTATLPQPAFPNSSTTGDNPTWWTIGRHWLGVDYISSGVRPVGYVNRTTGQAILNYGWFPTAKGNVALIPDLDSEDLVQRLCAPLRPRSKQGARGASAQAPFSYRRPYGATLSNTRSGTRVLLGRCGVGRQTVLSQCKSACGDPVVGDRAVAWVEAVPSSASPQAGRLYVRLMDRARTWSWRVTLPRDPDYTSDPMVAIISRRVFVLQRGRLSSMQLPAARR